MITIISGTNRKGSATEKFAKYFFKLVKSKTKQPVKYFSLQKLPEDMLHVGMYTEKKQSKKLRKIQEEVMIPAEKFIFVSPEYNGSFPGVLKLFLDACSIHEYKSTFKGKKAGLVGIASGRSGNLRGMDHLSCVLNHVGTEVMGAKLPISQCENLIDEKGEISDKSTLQAIESHVDAFLTY
ncbi:MAG: NAD(P)H-dependent oxidoreductase [Saprospiraceae bacterium]|nr:NAD(P)H-dependent oxidoreductase [Saprospiraceae bacterium]MDG1436042.1 NAD(P)H-dependent oxidoreductase [Saprospiraceae bacterium]MDG2418258.1 NAD(P)H-dependent oxidoreductase [Saprospiraceae bacterium]